MKEQPKGISRRDLFRTAAVLGGSAALTTFVGCSAGNQAQNNTTGAEGTWDEETNFIIVGAGSGIFAALTLKDKGIDAIVFEKSSVYGGTTFLSGGGFWVPGHHLKDATQKSEDEPSKVLEYVKACDLYGTGEEELILDWLTNSPKAHEYVANTLGFKLAVSTVRDYNNYINWGARQLSIVDNDDLATGVKAWSESGRPVVDAAGLDIRFESEVTEVIVDETGTVQGVKVTINGTEKRIKADKGVLLAAGGFDYNKDMVKTYLRGPLTGSVVVPTSTGDGHRIGMELGADLANMGSVFGTNAYKVDDSGELSQVPEHLYFRTRPNSLIVNSNGRRFFNEGGSYDTSGTALFNIDCGGKAASLVSLATLVCDSRFVADYGYPGVGPDVELPTWIHTYDTLEALADGEGIDKERFLEEIERFNGFCETGVDRDFHRGETGFEAFPVGSGLATFGLIVREDLANPYLGPLTTAPFYAAKIGAGSFGTSGGLRVNKYAEVLRKGEPIPHLYAAGLNAASFVSGYPGPGTSVASGVYRSVRAVDHAFNLGIIE
jgi:succinate dehydrogenase/fumarate reductase flavoprotein subunit